MSRLAAFKAETLFRVAGFVSQKHKSPIKRGIANAFLWIARGRQRSGALDFIDDDSSIDHLDFEDIDDARAEFDHSQTS